MSVQNTGGTYAGKETVQVYATLPQTGMEKEKKRLVGFAKTKCLLPGEIQQLEIKIPKNMLASFSEEQSAWYLEAGTYGIWIGADSQKLEQAWEFDVYERTLTEHTCRLEAAESDAGKLSAAEEQKVHLTGKIPAEELIPLLYGHVEQNSSTLGAAGIRVPGSAGETTHALEQPYGIRALIMADGPAGIRLHQSYEVDADLGKVYGKSVLGALENGYLEPMQKHENARTYYQFCTAIPVGTLLAQSWNVELIKEVGEMIGHEMELFHVTLWLAPGMNIHRNPLCGRNFEYYSEDPLLAGMMASAMTLGVQKVPGCGTTIKHFACNNQEDNRMGSDSILSERALREIYLKGFEIAVKDAQPMSIMTSYNLINGVHAANCYDTCTKAARDEWGFAGAIMTDWTTTNVQIQGECTAAGCMRAGNDMVMPGLPEDHENIKKELAEGTLTMAELKRCIYNTVNIVLQSNMYEGAVSYLDQFDDLDTYLTVK